LAAREDYAKKGYEVEYVNVKGKPDALKPKPTTEAVLAKLRRLYLQLEATKKGPKKITIDELDELMLEARQAP